jgi:hypothetical protein
MAGCGHSNAPAAQPPAKPNPYQGIPLDHDSTRVADAVAMLSGVDPCGFIDPNMARQYGKLRLFGPVQDLHDCEADIYNPGDATPSRILVELQNNGLSTQNAVTTVGAAKVYTAPTVDATACGYYVPLADASDPLPGDFRFALVQTQHFLGGKTQPCEVAAKVATVVATAVRDHTLPRRTGAEQSAYPLAERNACELFSHLPAKYTVLSSGATPAKPGTSDPGRPQITVGSCAVTVDGPGDAPTTTPTAQATTPAGGQVSVSIGLAAQNSGLPKPVAPAHTLTVDSRWVLVSPNPGAPTSTIAFVVGDVIDNNLPKIPPGNTFTNPDYLGAGRAYQEVTVTLPDSMVDDLVPAAVRTFTAS